MGGIPLSYSEKIKWEAGNIKESGKEERIFKFWNRKKCKYAALDNVCWSLYSLRIEWRKFCLKVWHKMDGHDKKKENFPKSINTSHEVKVVSFTKSYTYKILYRHIEWPLITCVGLISGGWLTETPVFQYLAV